MLLIAESKPSVSYKAGQRLISLLHTAAEDKQTHLQVVDSRRFASTSLRRADPFFARTSLPSFQTLGNTTLSTDTTSTSLRSGRASGISPCIAAARKVPSSPRLRKAVGAPPRRFISREYFPKLHYRPFAKLKEANQARRGPAVRPVATSFSRRPRSSATSIIWSSTHLYQREDGSGS